MRKNIKKWGIKITQFKASLMAKKNYFVIDAHIVLAA
jgi:hypothetical protein